MMALLKARQCSLYYLTTPPDFSVFWHHLCFTNLKNVPSVLLDTVPTLSRAGYSHHLVSIPRHAHPPTGARGEHRTEPHGFGAAVRAASHTPLVKQQTRRLSSRCGNSLWRPSCVRAQLARGLPPHPAPTTPAARPSWALLRPGGTGTHWHGRDGQHGTTERAKMQHGESREVNNSTLNTTSHLFVESLCPRMTQRFTFPVHGHKSLLGRTKSHQG